MGTVFDIFGWKIHFDHGEDTTAWTNRLEETSAGRMLKRL